MKNYKYGYEVTEEGRDIDGEYYARFEFGNGYGAVVRRKDLNENKWRIYVLLGDEIQEDFELWGEDFTDCLNVGSEDDINGVLEEISEMEEVEMTQKEKMAELAKQGWDYFEVKERFESKENFLVLKEDAPQWIRDLMNVVHEQVEESTNDWIYTMVRENFVVLEDHDSEDWDDIQTYYNMSNKDLLDWVHGRMDRVDKLMEARRYTRMDAALDDAFQKMYDEVRYHMIDFLRKETE